MPFVVAHAKFLRDQVGYARAGPQRGFITQALWTLEQQGLQALTVFLAQARLAARPSGFPQRGLALGSILLHPAGHGLTNHLDLRAMADWFSPRSNRRMAWKRRFSRASKSRRTPAGFPMPDWMQPIGKS